MRYTNRVKKLEAKTGIKDKDLKVYMPKEIIQKYGKPKNEMHTHK